MWAFGQVWLKLLKLILTFNLKAIPFIKTLILISKKWVLQLSTYFIRFDLSIEILQETISFVEIFSLCDNEKKLLKHCKEDKSI